MVQRSYDIVIIGGGPAGSASALYAARAGFSVCLLEKQAFPREILCGEFLSHEAVSIIADLGLGQEFLSLGPAPVRRLAIYPEHGPPLSAPLGFTAYGLRRSRFDQMLLEAARSRGVSIVQPAEVDGLHRVKDGFEVWCRTPEGPCTVRGSWAVGAYGKSNRIDKQLHRSFTAKRTGLNGIKFHVPASMLANVKSDEILIFPGPGMYCGINHVDGGSATLCFLEQHRRSSAPPRGRLRELAEVNLSFAHVMTPDALVYIEHSSIHGTGNIYFGRRSVVEDGILMVGDAARVIAPLAGDGISMALQGAQLLGRIFEEEYRKTADRNIVEETYRREWERLFAARVRAASLFQKIFLSTTLRHIGKFIFTMAPFLLRPALNVTRGGHASQSTLRELQMTG